MRTDPLFDYYSPAFRADPYPLYARLRKEDPVHWGLPFEPYQEGSWQIARYADVNLILKDLRFGKAALTKEGTAGLPEEVRDYLDLTQLALLRADPPDHTRLRALASKAFTPRMVEGLRPRVEAIATGLLESAGDEMDIISEYAYPLSITVITEMLGLSHDDRDQLRHWAGILVDALDSKRTLDIYAPAMQASAEIFMFFQEQIAEQRRQPRPGILSELVAAHEEGDRLTESELIVTCTLLLIAGHDTTVNLVGNGMLALLRNPEQMALLREHPEVIQSAVEEFLRYDSSSQMTSRIAQQDVEIGGKTIHTGDPLNLLVGSANHDPEQFGNPDVLDITRKDNRHIAFGHGIHYCLGAPLARLEAQVAIPLLLTRRQRMRLAVEEPARRDTIGFRGLLHLPITG